MPRARVHSNRTTESIERRGNLRTRGEIGRVKPRNAAVIAAVRYAATDGPRYLDLQIRQGAGVGSGVSNRHGSGWDIVAARRGLDDQLESGSSAALKHRDAVLSDRHRRVQRTVRACNADEGDLGTDARLRSLGRRNRWHQQASRQLDDVRGADDLIAIDVRRYTRRFPAGGIGKKEGLKGLQIRAVDDPIAVDIPRNGRLTRLTEHQP